MLSRFSLVVILLFCISSLFAQADSLFVNPDTLYTAPDSTAAIDLSYSKEEIKRWIMVERSDNTANVMASQEMYLDGGDVYRNGYFYISRPNVMTAYRNGFEQPSGIFGAGLYHAYYHSMYAGSAVNYRTGGYPFTPALTTIQGGLADYEHHYAKVSLQKNALLSFPNLCYQGDLLVQNGLWTDIISAETSMKHYLMGSLGNFTLVAEYSNYAKDVAMSELLPVYWLSSNFMISHQIKQFYAAVKHPWLELSVINSRETAEALAFYKTLYNNATQLKLGLGNDTGDHKYQAFYEYADREANSDFSGSFDSDNYKQKLGLHYDSFMPVGIGIKAEWLDWKRGRLFADLGIPIGGSYLGAFAEARLGSDASVDSVQNIYGLSGYFPLLDISEKREQGVYLRYEWQGISSVLALGSKYIVQDSPVEGFAVKDEQPFVRLAVDAAQKWRNWELKAREQWIWTKANEGLCENPEFRFNSVQNLYYHLPWNNSLVAGFGLSGHSGYYAANAISPNLIEASSVLDAWGGFDLDALFEIRAGVKNALSSSLYGAYPMPWTLYAEIRWAFIN